MLIFLYGPDTYRSRERLNQLKEGFRKKHDLSGFNIISLQTDELNSGELHQALSVAGLFSPKRLVVIEGFFRKKIKKELVNEILERFEKIKNDEQIIVIFWDGEVKLEKGMPEAQELLKKLKAEKESKAYDLMKPLEIEHWLKNETVKKGGKISSEAMKKIMTYAGDDLWNLSQEIDKLIAYQGKGKEITAAEVEKLVKAKIDENIFHLVDAVAEKNARQGLKLINDQLESGQPWGYLFPMIVRQFRLLLIIGEKIKNEGLSYSRNWANDLNIHPFVIKKTITQAQKYQPGVLEKIYDKLLDLDRRLKRDKITPETLFDLLVLEVCH